MILLAKGSMIINFGDVGGTSTTDALVEMTHKCYEATDVLNNFVRVVLLAFSKAFDLINHHILVDKLITNGVPAHIVRWLAAFLLDRQQQVKIDNIYSRTGSWRSATGNSIRAEMFFYYI